MFDTFISYRRQDSRADAGRLYDRLSAPCTPRLGHFLEFRWSQAVDATPGAKGEREA